MDRGPPPIDEILEYFTPVAHARPWGRLQDYVRWFGRAPANDENAGASAPLGRLALRGEGEFPHQASQFGT